MSTAELWIVLRKINLQTSTEFQQEGPYSTDQVKELILRGIVQSTDYVWKKGDTEWVPILQVPEFNLKEIQKIEEPPPEKFAEIVEYSGPDKDGSVTEKAIKIPAKPAPTKSARWIQAGALASLFVLVGAGSYYHKNIYAYYQELSKESAVVVKNEKSEKLEKSDRKEKPSENTATAESESKLEISPGVVAVQPEVETERAEVLSSAITITEQGQDFTIRGPFRSGEKLAFALKGKTGQVLEVPALYLHANVLVTKTGEVFIDHKNFQIPEGYYDILVIYDGDKTLKKKLTLIVDELKFKSALLKHRKQISYDQLNEKKNLIRYLASLEAKPTKKKGKAAKNTSKTMPKELQWVTQDRNYLIYRKEWEKLNNLVSNNREPASDKNAAAIIRKMKTEVMQKSSRSMYR